MSDWREEYQRKLVSPDEAVRCIESGDQVFTYAQAAMPVALMEALARRKDELRDVTVYGANTMYPYSILQSSDYRGKINYATFFFQGYEHQYFDRGNVSIISPHFSRLAKCLSDVYHVNVLMMEVAPPDEEGYLYFGIVGTAAGWDVAQKADKIILQINRKQPRAHGYHNRIHIRDVTWLTECDQPLPEYLQPESSEVDRKISELIIPMIPEGATLQLGLGGLSNAIGYGLKDRRNLSIHTEMYSDSMMYLAKRGAISGKQVAGFAQGSQALYDYISEGHVEFMPLSIINDPVEISKNDNMISINTCIMADLTGQVCSESIGFRQYSGTGGQLDFVRGAAMSKGGKSFLCLSSTRTDKQGKRHSKITVDFPKGAVVTTPRSDVMYIVTEYGIADLYLRSIEDRVHAMISIAHPDFRKELHEQAVQNGLIRD